LNTSKVRSTAFRPLYEFFFWTLVADCVLLGYIGQCPVEDPFILIGQIASVYYFAFFFVIVPSLGHLEEKLLRANAVENPSQVQYHASAGN
jgi:quinol-cytochrome oxidoreductase complex cytochrome b subunit